MTITPAQRDAIYEAHRMASRHPRGRDGRRRLPDRWSIGPKDERDDPARGATQRLRPGQLDGVVLDSIDSQDTAVGATAVAKALGRSAGAVGNCLTRLAAAGRVRQVSDQPRRYSSATAASSKKRRSRKEKSSR